MHRARTAGQLMVCYAERPSSNAIPHRTAAAARLRARHRDRCRGRRMDRAPAVGHTATSVSGASGATSGQDHRGLDARCCGAFVERSEQLTARVDRDDARRVQPQVGGAGTRTHVEHIPARRECLAGNAVGLARERSVRGGDEKFGSRKYGISGAAATSSTGIAHRASVAPHRRFALPGPPPSRAQRLRARPSNV